MARGWIISAFSPSAAGAAEPRVRFVVAIVERSAALRAIEAWYPKAKIVIDSEASAETIARHRVRDGTIFMLDDETSANTP